MLGDFAISKIPWILDEALSASSSHCRKARMWCHVLARRELSETMSFCRGESVRHDAKAINFVSQMLNTVRRTFKTGR